MWIQIGVHRAQPASSRERRVAAAIAWDIAIGQASGFINTDSASAVVPPGLVTATRRADASSGAGREQRAGAGDGLAGQQASQIGRDALLDRGLLHQFGKQEDVRGAAAGYRGDGVEQRFVLDPGDLADGLQQAVAQSFLLAC